MPALSATSIQGTYKTGVITMFGRFSSTGAAGNQPIILTGGASKGFATLVAEATAGLYTLTLDDSVKATSIMGSPVISYIFNSSAAGTVRVARVLSESVNTAGASSIQFYAQNDAGAGVYYPANTTITITLTISTSSVF